jgi:hypothetical protein
MFFDFRSFLDRANDELFCMRQEIGTEPLCIVLNRVVL